MYIVRNKITKTIIRESKTPITIDGSTPIGLDPELEIIEVKEDAPSFDTTVEKLAQVETIVDGKTLLVNQPVELTKEDLAVRADFEAKNQALIDAHARYIQAIKDNKDKTDWGAVLYDQAVGRGEIIE